MLCSPTELEPRRRRRRHPDPAPTGATPGTPITRRPRHRRATSLWDLEINPNRPDAMSVAGVARDLAARYGVPFALPAPSVVPSRRAGAVDVASVEILDPDLCGRFTATVLRGVRLGPSPDRASPAGSRCSGMRPINNVVDVSNYVMLELGQPNHPYDLAALPGGGLRVRRARDGETLVTLDDVERRFTADDLLICDGDDRPIGIAGSWAARHRDRRVDDRRAARDGVVQPDRHRQDVAAARAAHRGVGPVREGRRPRGHRPGRRTASPSCSAAARGRRPARSTSGGELPDRRRRSGCARARVNACSARR